MNKDNFLTKNIEQYADKNEINYSRILLKIYEKTKPLNIVIYILEVVLFLVVLAIMTYFGARPNPNVLINGLLAQVMVVLSVILAIQHPKKATGCKTAYILNALVVANVTTTMILRQSITALVGLIVPLSTIFVIAILHIFGIRLYSCLMKLDRQRDELVALNEETRQAYEEMAVINDNLINSNKVIEETKQRISKLSMFDPLTDLANRQLILNRTDTEISIAHEQNRSFAIAFLDVNDFKTVNDMFGHSVGDQLIKGLSDRLKFHVNKTDLLGRLSGAQFAILITRPITNEEITCYANKIAEELEAPFKINGNEIAINISLGAAFYPNDADNTTDLFKCTDIALHNAKRNSTVKFSLYSSSMGEEVLKRAGFELKLTNAMKNSEFFMVFQPQFSASDKRLMGFEALIRWNSACQGNVSPIQFIPLAEETGLIVELGYWILEESCNTLREVNARSGCENIKIAVNISPVQLKSQGFIDKTKEIINKTQIDKNNLEFEITESVFIDSFEETNKIIEQLIDFGINFSLDDFGTGYSSLSYLHALPIKAIKIDKTFVDGIGNSTVQKLICSIIALAHNMNIDVVSEGVETQEQFDFLNEQKCDIIQGFLLGKPMEKEEMNLLLETV